MNEIMKYDITLRVFGKLLSGLVRPEIPDRQQRKEILQEYRTIMSRAEDIGSNNMLIGSYALAGFFIAMNRKDNLSAQRNYEILDRGMRGSKLLKLFFGDEKTYFSEKKMQTRRAWSAKTHEHQYKNDWVVDVLEQTDDFVFGLDYTACGVCALCRDEGCFELAHYLCKLDFMLVEIIGVRLDRTTTLADGGDKCDFRFKHGA